MEILFFTHYFPPEANAPASRTFEHCRVWARDGHKVTVVTCAPNHPKGKIYNGYRNRLFQREVIEGISVVRVWTFLAANEGFLLRICNYLSFFVCAILALPCLPKPDIVISTSPQFFCGLIGFVAKVSKRTPWILEIRDLWPESILTVGAMRKSVVIRILERLETFAYRNADQIVSVTDSFVPHIAERRGRASGIAVIKNGADLSLFTPFSRAGGFKSALGCEGKFVAAYVGTHGMAHGLETILEAAEILRGHPTIQFLLVGEGAERARIEALRNERSLSNVLILGQRPKADMPAIWSATDASLILLRRNDAFKKVIPSKMFEAMAMRCPIILGVEGEARRLLDDSGAGIGITPEDAQALAAAVQKLAANAVLSARFGEQGADYVRQHYDREKLAGDYLVLLSEAAFAYHHRIVPAQTSSRAKR